MRLTGPRGVAVRAAAALAVNLVLALFVVGFLGGLVVLFAYEVTGGGLVSNPLWLVVAVVAAALAGAAGLCYLSLGQIRRERAALVSATIPASEATRVDDAAAEATLSRLAARFDVPEPTLRIHRDGAPLAYSTYRPGAPQLRMTGDEAPIVVVSWWLAAELSAAEFEAVLAHELAHVANDDLRLVSWLLVPVFFAESWDSLSTDDDTFWRFVAGLGLGSLGVFSRGREIAADRAAARAIGDPATLASALQRLSEADPHDASAGVPTTDLRSHAGSANAVNVVPAFGRHRDEGTWSASHPPLSVRLAELRALEAE